VVMQTYNGVPYLRTNRPEQYGTQWDEDACRYMWGQCHALALAILQERPTWTLVGQWYSDDVYPDHVLVSPNGIDLLDVNGVGFWDEDDDWFQEIGYDTLAKMVETDSYAIPVLDQHTRELAGDLIKSWERTGAA